MVCVALIALASSCGGEESSQPDANVPDAVTDAGAEALDTPGGEGPTSCTTAENCGEPACNDFDKNCFGNWCIAGTCQPVRTLWQDAGSLPESFQVENFVVEDYYWSKYPDYDILTQETGTVTGLRIDNLSLAGPSESSSVVFNGVATVTIDFQATSVRCGPLADGCAALQKGAQDSTFSLAFTDLPCTVSVRGLRLPRGANGALMPAYVGGSVDPRGQAFEYSVSCRKQGNFMVEQTFSLQLNANLSCRNGIDAPYLVSLAGGAPRSYCGGIDGQGACNAATQYPPLSKMLDNGSLPSGAKSSAMYAVAFKGGGAAEWPLIDGSVNMHFPADCGSEPW
jgi:hypothetical protein